MLSLVISMGTLEAAPLISRTAETLTDSACRACAKSPFPATRADDADFLWFLRRQPARPMRDERRPRRRRRRNAPIKVFARARVLRGAGAPAYRPWPTPALSLMPPAAGAGDAGYFSARISAARFARGRRTCLARPRAPAHATARWAIGAGRASWMRATARTGREVDISPRRCEPPYAAGTARLALNAPRQLLIRLPPTEVLPPCFSPAGAFARRPPRLPPLLTTNS